MNCSNQISQRYINSSFTKLMNRTPKYFLLNKKYFCESRASPTHQEDQPNHVITISALYKFIIVEHVTPFCTGVGALAGSYWVQKEIIKDKKIEAIPLIPFAILGGGLVGYAWARTSLISFPLTWYICHKINEQNDHHDPDPNRSIKFFIQQELIHQH
ncbi:MAG: hypothetical protein Q8K60_07115 [Parachlamydiaceae bacterium]|nr:hypothetical protein [Parachlamydiaceae bacterium]